MIKSEEELQKRLWAFYTRYYREQLGLADWQQRVESRIDEETTYAGRILDWLQTWLRYDFAGARVLVVGGGTGAETLALRRRGAAVAAVEPDTDALSVLDAKARLRTDAPALAVQAVAEALPYSSSYFDLVYCFTVLEHTQDPIRSIDEMIRVARPQGWVFIVTPDYRRPYEPHYKIPMPTMAPRWVQRLWLRGWRRPVEYLATLQFTNAHFLRNAFQRRPVTAFQVIHSWPRAWLAQPTAWQWLSRWLAQAFGVQTDQYWLLQKLEEPR